ncbi:MAG: sel1 repeat family protein, partial [Alphaproteobacteria bacterium]|nr:sel1 repeat family protein [Alphaproteobacteria bacterium]
MPIRNPCATELAEEQQLEVTLPFLILREMTASLHGEITPDYVRDQKRRAEQGDDNAQYEVGVMYRDGEGVPQNHEMAARWFRLAAGQAHVDAQINLIVMMGIK